MYYFLIAFYLINIVIAAIIPGDKDARILSYEYKHFGKGLYYFSFDTSNGIKRKETGRLVNAGQDNEHIAVVGHYSYTDPDGNPRVFQYTADANGFHINSQDKLEEGILTPGYPVQPGTPLQPGLPGYPGQPGQPLQPGLPGYPISAAPLPDAVLQSLVGGK